MSSNKAKSLYDILRDYQKDAIRAFRDSGYRGIVELPTGAGKTYIAYEIAREMLAKRMVDRVIVAVPTIALAMQWESVFKRHGMPMSFGYTISDNIFVYPTFIKMAEKLRKQQTIESFAQEGKRPRILLIVDEVHHAHMGTKLFNAIKKLDPEYGLGLSATLDEHEIYPWPVVFSLTYSDIRKYLPNVSSFVVLVEPSDEFKTEYDNLTQMISSTLRKLRRYEKAEVENNPSIKQEVKKLKEAYERAVGQRYSLVASNEDSIFAAVAAAYHLPGKTLVFTLRRSVMKLIATAIEQLGKRAIMIKSKRDVEALFKDNYDVIVAAEAISEGVDLPDVDNIVLQSYKRNIRSLIQRIGRGMRGGPNKELRIVAIVIEDTYMGRSMADLFEFLGATPAVVRVDELDALFG